MCIIVNVTPLEPEWEGHVTLEFSNTTCQRKFMQMKALHNLFFYSQMSFARPLTKIGMENILDKKVLHYQKYKIY